MKIISLVGKKRSGKDSTADVICENRSAMKYALARPIKDSLAHVYVELKYSERTGVTLTKDSFEGIDYDREQNLMLSNSDVHKLLAAAVQHLKECYNLKTNGFISNIVLDNIMSNSKPWNVRRLMQTLGTDIVCNTIDANFWLKCMMNVYFDNLGKGIEYFIITDVRQEHEVSFIRTVGLMLFIERDSINNNIQDTHITEAGIKRLHDEILIKNNGSLDDLKHSILEVI